MAFGTPAFNGLVVPAAAQPITIAGITLPRTWTVPDANFTVARKDAPQTLVGPQTFTGSGAALATAAIVADGSYGGGIYLVDGGNYFGFSSNGTTLSLAINGSNTVNFSPSGLVKFFGTDSSYPMLKRSGTTLQHRLADDSADGPMSASTGTFSGALIGTPQALSGAGAVNVTTLTTAFTSTGVADALTLANGTNGQIKIIEHVADGGSGVLTPTTANGFSIITFTNVGESATLCYHTTGGWVIESIRGAIAA